MRKLFEELAHNFMSSYKEKVDQQAKIFCGTKNMLSELRKESVYYFCFRGELPQRGGKFLSANASL